MGQQYADAVRILNQCRELPDAFDYSGLNHQPGENAATGVDLKNNKGHYNRRYREWKKQQPVYAGAFKVAAKCK